jgi:integrase
VSGGTIRQADNGTWWYQVTVREGGKPQHIKRRGFARKRDAQKAATELLAAYGKGDRRVLKRPSNATVAEYLDSWLTARTPSLKPSTVRSYSLVISSWITPHLGRIPLRDLTGQRIAEWHATLRDSGGKGGRPLSSRTVQYAWRVLTMVLADAVESGALVMDPSKEIPRWQRPTHRPAATVGTVWDAAQASAFLASTADHRLHALWALLLDSGCRRGEALALRWSDLADDAITIARNRVQLDNDITEGSPKTGRARTVDPAPGDGRCAAPLATSADRGAAGRRPGLVRQRLHVHDRGGRAVATRDRQPGARARRRASETARDPAARSAARQRNSGAVGRRPGARRQRPPGPQRSGDHAAGLQPLPADQPAGRGRPDRRAALRVLGGPVCRKSATARLNRTFRERVGALQPSVYGAFSDPALFACA